MNCLVPGLVNSTGGEDSGGEFEKKVTFGGKPSKSGKMKMFIYFTPILSVSLCSRLFILLRFLSGHERLFFLV